MADNAMVEAQQERERRDRVRLVRRLSKWLTRADAIAHDAAAMKRDGVTVPDGWGFDFTTFSAMVHAVKKYLTDALAGATGGAHGGEQ